MKESLEYLQEQSEEEIMVEDNIREVVRGHIVKNHVGHIKDLRFYYVHYEAIG